MQIYTNELTHSGIKGMKWGKRVLSGINRHESNYNKKLKEIANNKNAHEFDREVATQALRNRGVKLVSTTMGAVGGQLIKDVLSGDIKNYGKHTTEQLIKKAINIGKSVATSTIKDEVISRSVANKYNSKGDRVKGSGKSKYTREQVIGNTARVASFAAPIVGRHLGKEVYKKFAEKQINVNKYKSYGSNILNAKNKDYSNIISNVKYTVK